MKKVITKSLITSILIVATSFAIGCTSNKGTALTESCGGDQPAVTQSSSEGKTCKGCGKDKKDCACKEKCAHKEEHKSGCCGK